MTRYEAIEKALRGLFAVTSACLPDAMLKDYETALVDARYSASDALALPEDDGWMPIESAPHGDTAPSILLGCAGTPIPVYCGRLRFGTFGEPQQDLCAWRCDSSGRFANPTHWAPLRNPPKREASGEPMPYKVVRDGDKVRFE